MPCGAGRSSCAFRDDWWVQGRSDDQRELLEAESVAGQPVEGRQRICVLGAYRRQLFPEERFSDLFLRDGAARVCRPR